LSYIYKHSRSIEDRFDVALALIRNDRLNAEQLATKLGVSKPTTHRIITELKRRGHPIQPIYENGYWSYRISHK